MYITNSLSGFVPPPDSQDDYDKENSYHDAYDNDGNDSPDPASHCKAATTRSLCARRSRGFNISDLGERGEDV